MSDGYIRQVILIRKDLNMRKGMIAAQGAHASMKVFFDQARKFRIFGWAFMLIPMSLTMYRWAIGSFAKVCRYCTSEEELLKAYHDAKAVGLPCALIVDEGRTEFHGVPTLTCVAVGPADADTIDKVIGRHPLY